MSRLWGLLLVIKAARVLRKGLSCSAGIGVDSELDVTSNEGLPQSNVTVPEEDSHDLSCLKLNKVVLGLE